MKGSQVVIVIKGAGEMATGVATRLYRANFRRILMLERQAPLAVRRQVSFCEAIHEGIKTVEGIEAVSALSDEEITAFWEAGKIPVLVDPEGAQGARFRPEVFIDATVAKRKLGTSKTLAPLVIALGPGFIAGIDCHVVIETNRGHNLGRMIYSGAAEANSGIPGNICGHTVERVLRSPAAGRFTGLRNIGELVKKGDLVGRVDRFEVIAGIDGVLRGVIRTGTDIGSGVKVGDIDPRGDITYCNTISEKARALGGSVLEAVVAQCNA